MLSFYLSLINDDEYESKFEQIYRLYKNQMLYVSYQILKNQHDSEDAVHTAFVKIAMNMNKIIDPQSKNAKNYCLKAAKNVSLNMTSLKSTQNKPLEENEAYYDNLLDKVCKDETFETVKKVISNLDDIYKDVLTMHYVYDMSVTQISELFDRNKSTVKKQLLRGKKILCENLKKELNRK